MTYPKHVTIDTSDIPAADKAEWRCRAERLANYGFHESASVIRAFANALPDGWPTAPGSTARTEYWARVEGLVRYAVVDETGNWRIAGYVGTWPVDDLIERGFAPLHDAGAEK